jgi:hypothetical protein
VTEQPQTPGQPENPDKEQGTWLPGGSPPTEAGSAGEGERVAGEPESRSKDAPAPISAVEPAISPAPAPAPPVATPPPPFDNPSATDSPSQNNIGGLANQRPEVAVGAAFAGGFLIALILKRLAR